MFFQRFKLATGMINKNIRTSDFSSSLFFAHVVKQTYIYPYFGTSSMEKTYLLLSHLNFCLILSNAHIYHYLCLLGCFTYCLNQVCISLTFFIPVMVIENASDRNDYLKRFRSSILMMDVYILLFLSYFDLFLFVLVTHLFLSLSNLYE